MKNSINFMTVAISTELKISRRQVSILTKLGDKLMNEKTLRSKEVL